MPEGAAAAAAAGMSGLSTQHFTQMCFAVYAQIVLDRIFDDYPLAIRMFLVQKVRLASTVSNQYQLPQAKQGQGQVCSSSMAM